MKIIFFGTPGFVLPILDSLFKTNNVAAVVTTPDAPVGRKQIMTPTPVNLAAEKLGVPILTPRQLNKETMKQLVALHPDLFVVASYGKIIPQELLAVPALGGINVHPSKLPELRGTSPIQYAILEGRKETALTIIQMDHMIDHGPILKQIPVTISHADTFETLAYKMFQLAADLLPQVITDLQQGKILPHEQDHTKATFTKRHLTKKDGYFDLESPPPKEQLDRMIRAFYPWPNAWTRWFFDKTQGKNGKIVKFYPEGKIQMEGKRIVSIKEFFNGYPNAKETFSKLFE